ncbi:MAG: DUF1294 domain-containing protein [Eubacterium sp.]|nr:DUF1294 domain-containing protein [Eubacterium sp.]
MPKPVIIYLVIINIIGLCMMGVDKGRARNHEWRIPEAALFGVSFAGGALGSLAGMYLFRHKTQHASFVIGIPVILIIWIIVLVRVF